MEIRRGVVGQLRRGPVVGALKKSGQGSVYIYAPRSHVGIQERGYPGRIGEANLPLFLANPRRYNPKTAMTFPGLRREKDIDDVIAYITGGR